MSREPAYSLRFSRNLGILTADEQSRLRMARVAVAGVGGLGGHTLTNLARMGVGHFTIADIDTFDIANTNRQIGATQKSLGRKKVSTMAEMVLDINPDAEVREVHDGIKSETVDDFVRGCDAVVDSLDFFCLSARRILYDACERHGKTVLLSAPLGLSATLHAFSPTSMSADRFFDWRDGMDRFEQMLRFAVGIAPAGLHLRYLSFDKHRLVSTGTGPSIATGCSLGGALLATEVLMALLARRPLFQAPVFTQFDMHRGVYVRRRLVFGNRGPLQRLKIQVARRQYGDVREQLMGLIK